MNKPRRCLVCDRPIRKPRHVHEKCQGGEDDIGACVSRTRHTKGRKGIRYDP